MKRDDYTAALRLFRAMAEMGYANAQFQLGFLYRKGEGVPQDYAEALKWFRLAANQGHASSQSNLGFMYRDGEGVQPDFVQAHMWFNLASAAASGTSRHMIAEYLPQQLRLGVEHVRHAPGSSGCRR
jgi:TPR repeat protein